jgi:hypothetical protein
MELPTLYGPKVPMNEKNSIDKEAGNNLDLREIKSRLLSRGTIPQITYV